MARLLEKQCRVTRPVAGELAATVAMTATIQKGAEMDTLEVPVTVMPWTDEEAVTLELNDITYERILGNNSSENQITQDLTLITEARMGTNITWSSRSESVISVSAETMGEVTRPSYTVGDLVIVLTVKVESGSVSRTKDFTFRVIRLDQTVEEELTSYVGGLSVQTLLLSNSDAESITSDLYFPLQGPNGISNSWESSEPLVITNTGTVFRPEASEGQKTVTITLTASKLTKTETKTFTFRVRPEEI